MVSLKETDEQMVILYGKDLAALLILFISFIGVCGNTTVAVFTKQLPTMNNPFGRMLASQATGEAILCSGFLFYYFPMVFWDIEWMVNHSGIVGYIQLICYDICVWSHFFISVNRFVAICFPTQYETVFSRRNTWIIIIFTWAVAISFETMIHYLPTFGDSCLLILNPVYWAYLFEDNKVCNFLGFYVDFYKDITFVILIAIIDVITIWNVHRTNKIMATVSIAQRNRRRREVNFLKQAVLQMLAFIVELNTYFIWCEKFLDKKWVFWFMTSVAWCTVHTVDGIIIIMFNREFRKLITSPFRRLYSIAAQDSKDLTTGASPATIQGQSSQGIIE